MGIYLLSPKIRRTKYRGRRLSVVFIVVGVLILLITSMNMPVARLEVHAPKIIIHEHRKVVLTIPWLYFYPEVKYLAKNASVMRMDLILHGHSMKTLYIPLGAGKLLTLGSSISFEYNITGPTRLYVRDNLTNIKYLLAVISPKTPRAYIPLRTCAYRGVIEVQVLSYGARIDLVSEERLVLRILIMRNDLSKMVIWRPMFRVSSMYINETYTSLVVVPFLLIGPLHLRVEDGCAKLYPQDNLILFIAISLALILAGSTMRILRRYSKRSP